MSLSDRRLLIELGTVLVIKVAIIMSIKFVYFSPQAEQAPVDLHFLQEAREANSTEPASPPEIIGKER
ncbi:cytochrome oxidase putative small subunit CydP [Microbulbifer sp.]|uniref:cytochrome oxidase putative small subunit CydP n=1 Tax=Microbulbifer sp. TaxID=1908541 RepID=UPI002F93251F